MVTRRVLVRGVVFVPETDLVIQLGVRRELLRSWHRRRRVARAHLDGEWWYDLEAAVEAEWETSSSGRGAPRRAEKMT